MYAILPIHAPADAEPIRLQADSVTIDEQSARVIFKLGGVIVGCFLNVNFYKIEA